MLKRPYLKQDGTIVMVDLSECKCSPSERRGPAGGVCWCGGAIPEAHLTPRAVDGGEVLPPHNHIYVDGYCACGHAVERHRH